MLYYGEERTRLELGDTLAETPRTTLAPSLPYPLPCTP
jgi:hypothetical protein